LLAGIRLNRQALISVYYDTDTAALHKARFALRVRKTDLGFVQTIKGEGPGELFDRPEWEQAIAGPHPDFGAIAGTPIEPLVMLPNACGRCSRPARARPHLSKAMA
jgi:inorganic triphosphatase YgiF